MIAACVQTAGAWWLNTIVTAAFTLLCRWVAVGVWHECERERQRERGRRPFDDRRT